MQMLVTFVTDRVIARIRAVRDANLRHSPAEDCMAVSWCTQLPIILHIAIGL